MDQNYDYLYKILLVGDAGVGKTSLMKWYESGTFDLESKATVGVEFLTKTLEYDGRVLQSQIWDTAGA